MKKANAFFPLIVSILLLTACRPAQAGDASLKILASTSVLADIAQNIAGDRLQINSLLPFGADPHAYQAAPADIMKIAESDLLILNGVEYEHFMEPLLENAGGERLVVEASRGLEPHQAGQHEAGDPHMWLDPNLVMIYVENIRNGLSQLDPQGAEVYNANADSYTARLGELDSWILTQVGQLPAERRLLVTNHEALGYFAERYGFEIVDSILPSFSSEASASAQEIAAVVDAVEASEATVIFLDEIENIDLAEQIASETGVWIVDDLHLESLTDGPPAGTYIDMMKHNVLRIVEGLR
jgi:ABC-type Zn uptake system ZnuABC Zn-binding protein ZnuA